MQRFEYYGDLEKVVQGAGDLYLKNGKKHHVSFEIAKRGEEKLLFNAILDDVEVLDSFSLLKSAGLDKIEGFGSDGREILVTGLFAKDSTVGSKTDSKVILNGYAGQCEIGDKVFADGFIAQFDLINFLFLGNTSVAKKSEEQNKVTRSMLQFQFSDFECKIEQVDNYKVIKQLLQRQGGVIRTSTLMLEVKSQSDYETVLEKIRKLCQLLSVARSTFINWGSCKIKDSSGDVIYELYGNALTRPFHGNKLINDLPQDTMQFLKSAWQAYDKYEEIFDMKRFFYGYADTYMNSFIETRSLNIAVLADNLSSRWAKQENREKFLDENLFVENLPSLRKGTVELLGKMFGNLKESHAKVMSSKAKELNRRPLDWKLKRLRKAFNCPISDDEISQFVYIRDSLAHSSLFPDDVDHTNAFLFMRHFLDRIVLSVLDYQGEYFDMQSRTKKNL